MIFLLSAIRTNSLKSGFKDGIPRLCGEKCLRTFTVLGLQGSPPPMRGKVTHRAEHHTAKRITPAYAGKSAIQVNGFEKTQDPPRLCGEKNSFILIHPLSLGSPPPMRGKVTEHTSSVTSCGDRPRLCGEKPRWIRFHLGYLGSPPPMRGKADRTRNKEGRNRITPAYAGKRFVCNFRLCNFWDHPRLCGEKKCSILFRCEG